MLERFYGVLKVVLIKLLCLVVFNHWNVDVIAMTASSSSSSSPSSSSSSPSSSSPTFYSEGLTVSGPPPSTSGDFKLSSSPDTAMPSQLSFHFTFVN